MQPTSNHLENAGRFLLFLGFAGCIAAFRVPDEVRLYAIIGSLVTFGVGCLAVAAGKAGDR